MQTTERVYDSLHHAYVVETKNAENQSIYFDYDYGRGLLSQETDLNGKITH
ncbi:MAG: hypothetical protein GY869_12975 [Planctomycetes bacterium]|nr:hypothetical protein [Planctomycetota bacterium]